MASQKFIKKHDRKGKKPNSNSKQGSKFPKKEHGKPQKKGRESRDGKKDFIAKKRKHQKVKEIEKETVEKVDDTNGPEPDHVENDFEESGQIEPPAKKSKKSKHKRMKITDEKNLDDKVTLETLNSDLKKYFEKKLKHKLSDLEIFEKNFKNDEVDGQFYFSEENESLDAFLGKSGVTIKNSSETQTFNILTISSSAIRCVDLKRIVLPTTSESSEQPVEKYKILKLFGKHMKLHEQVKLINDNVKKDNKYDICFATITRLKKLIEEGAVSLDGTVLFLDYNFRNKKYWVLGERS